MQLFGSDAAGQPSAPNSIPQRIQQPPAYNGSYKLQTDVTSVADMDFFAPTRISATVTSKYRAVIASAHCSSSNARDVAVSRIQEICTTAGQQGNCTELVHDPGWHQ